MHMLSIKTVLDTMTENKLAQRLTSYVNEQEKSKSQVKVYTRAEHQVYPRYHDWEQLQASVH